MCNPSNKIHKISIIIVVMALFVALIVISLIWLNIKNNPLPWCQQRLDSTLAALHQVKQPESYATFYSQKYGFGIAYPQTWHAFAKDNSVMITNQAITERDFDNISASGDVYPDLFGYSIGFYDLTNPDEKYNYTEGKRLRRDDPRQKQANEILTYILPSKDIVELFVGRAEGYQYPYLADNLGPNLLPTATAYIQHNNYGIGIGIWLVGSPEKQTKALEILEKTLWTIKFDH